MKRYLLQIFCLILLSAYSCKQNTPVVKEAVQQFNNQLTAEEKAGGVMTPEIMWKFRRLGTFALSPDGSSIIYTITDIDLKSEAKRTNIFKTDLAGTNPVQLTTDGGNSPQWVNNDEYRLPNELNVEKEVGNEKVSTKCLQR